MDQVDRVFPTMNSKGHQQAEDTPKDRHRSSPGSQGPKENLPKFAQMVEEVFRMMNSQGPQLTIEQKKHIKYIIKLARTQGHHHIADEIHQCILEMACRQRDFRNGTVFPQQAVSINSQAVHYHGFPEVEAPSVNCLSIDQHRYPLVNAMASGDASSLHHNLTRLQSEEVAIEASHGAYRQAQPKTDASHVPTVQTTHQRSKQSTVNSTPKGGHRRSTRVNAKKIPVGGQSNPPGRKATAIHLYSSTIALGPRLSRASLSVDVEVDDCMDI